jgi:hypothetical protein
VTVEPDPGAANERTALAWQRTALSVMAGSAALAKLTADRLGVAAMLSVVVGVPLGLWVMFESRARYRKSAGIATPRRRGGRAATALAVATFAVCLTELLALGGER